MFTDPPTQIVMCRIGCVRRRAVIICFQELKHSHDGHKFKDYGGVETVKFNTFLL
jgi:hypothetical protein